MPQTHVYILQHPAISRTISPTKWTLEENKPEPPDLGIGTKKVNPKINKIGGTVRILVRTENPNLNAKWCLYYSIGNCGVFFLHLDLQPFSCSLH